MNIQEALKAATKEAMLAKDKATLQILRMLSAALKQIEIDKQIEVTEEVALNEMVRQIKQRQDAASQFRANGRDDLAANEEAEIQVIRRFLPAQLSAAEMQAEVDRLFAESGLPQESASLGKLMPALKAALNGRADMAAVSQYLRQKLQS